jgi:hypothetical protein
MVLKKIIIGTRIMIADNENKVIFTKSDWDKAKTRYEKELAKKFIKEQRE